MDEVTVVTTLARSAFTVPVRVPAGARCGMSRHDSLRVRGRIMHWTCESHDAGLHARWPDGISVPTGHSRRKGGSS
jgi:hypothetical protein